MKKRTRTIEILIIATLTVAMLLVFPLSAACSNDSVSENLSDAEASFGGDEPIAEDEETDGENEGSEGAEVVSGNIFTELFALLGEHSAKLLSALAFIGSMIIMVCYKMGFLPMVKDGVHALASGVSKLGEDTGNITKITEKLRLDMQEGLSYTEDVLNKMVDTLVSLEAKLEEESATREELFALKTVMSAEVDMLYEIFMVYGQGVFPGDCQASGRQNGILWHHLLPFLHPAGKDEQRLLRADPGSRGKGGGSR